MPSVKKNTRYFLTVVDEYRHEVAELSLMERGAFDALRLHYMERRAPLPQSIDALCRIAGACTPSERKAVKVVVSTKFSVGDDGLLHNLQCDEEVERINGLLEQTSDAGKRSAQKRWRDNAGVLESNDRDNERSTNDVTKSCSKEVKSKEVKNKKVNIKNNIDIIPPLSLLKGREEEVVVDVHAPPTNESKKVGAYIDVVTSSSPDTKVSAGVVPQLSDEDSDGMAIPAMNVEVEDVGYEMSGNKKHHKFKVYGEWFFCGYTDSGIQAGDIVSFAFCPGLIAQDVTDLTITSNKQPDLCGN